MKGFVSTITCLVEAGQVIRTILHRINENDKHYDTGCGKFPDLPNFSFFAWGLPITW